MDGYEIEQWLNRNECDDTVIISRNHLDKFRGLWPSSYILNLDRDTEKGSHWVTIWIDSNGNGEYFDPIGLPPVFRNIEQFFEDNTRTWTYNNEQFQDLPTQQLY